MALAVAECSALLRSGYRGPVFKRLRDEYFNQTARSRAAGSIFCIRRAPSALRCVIGNALIAAPLCACAFWLNHCGLQEFNGVHTTAGGGVGGWELTLVHTHAYQGRGSRVVLKALQEFEHSLNSTDLKFPCDIEDTCREICEKVTRNVQNECSIVLFGKYVSENKQY